MAASSFNIVPPLLHWYHQNRRVLPFREDPTPYHIWVSEIMLQQTRVAAALAYYQRFIAALPDVAALAACGEEELHKLWEGLGYYSRVRNMQKAAKIVVEQYGGALPGDYEALLALPGIGEYTAGAIASIAFGLPQVAVDGNVLRVFARLADCHDDITLPATKKALSEQVKIQQPPRQAGDFNQAVMELGALVCVPANPACGACPLQAQCAGYKKGTAAALPRKAAKAPKTQHPITLVVVHSGAGVLLQKRPDKGLLAGLWQPFLAEGRLSREDAESELNKLLPGSVLTGELPKAKHIFTHKVWQMEGWQARCAVPPALPEGWAWARPEQLETAYTIPSAFKAYMGNLLHG